MQLTENTYEKLWTKLDALERCATAGLIGNARANLVEAGGIVGHVAGALGGRAAGGASGEGAGGEVEFLHEGAGEGGL